MEDNYISILMFKILYITTSYEQKNSSAAIRNNSLVKGLIEAGCKVTVLTPKWPSHMISDFFTDNNTAEVIYTQIQDLNILKRVSSSKLNKNNKLVTHIRAYIRDLIYFPDICKKWPSLINWNMNLDFDLIISSSDLKSSHFVGLEIKKKKKNIPWIQIWGDPWENDTNLGRLHRNKARRKEIELLNKADKVVYVSSLTRDMIVKKHPFLLNKTFHIPRGYYKTTLKKKNKENEISIIYSGALTAGRTPVPLLSAIEKYNRNNSKNIKVLFYGNYNSDIIMQLNQFSCAIVNPSIDYNEIISVYEKSDALLFIANRSDSTQIPGKFYDYCGTNLPIICLIDDLNSKLSSILHQYDRCLILENKEDYLLQNMDIIISNLNIKYPIIDSFSPKFIAKQILSLIE